MLNKIIANPIVKIAGVLTILYFGLLHDKTNPESLGNRLSSERVKKNITEIEEKGKFIATNVALAKKYAKQEQKNLNSSKIAVKEVKINNEGKELKCGQKAIIEYEIFTIDNKTLYSTENEEVIVGSQKVEFMEKNIIGMKEDSIRSLLIPQDFYTNDIKLTRLLNENRSGLDYKIKLKKILDNPNSLNISCE